MRLSLFSGYFWVSYFLFLFFSQFESARYGFIIHLISLLTLCHAVILLTQGSNWTAKFAKYTKLFFLIVVVLVLQTLSIPFEDIIREIYMFSMYWALWMIFKGRKINSDSFFYFALYGGALAVLLELMGINSSNHENWSTPVGVIPLPENGWRVNFGPPGSNSHFTAVISGLGFILCLHSIIFHGKNLRKLLVASLMLYFILFSGSRAVYIGVVAASLVIVFPSLCSKNIPIPKYGSYLFSTYLVLLMGLLSVYSTGFLATFFQEHISGELASSLTKSHLSDLSAGRIGLWALHISTFIDMPFGGGGSVLRTIELGDSLSDGEVLSASSESFFTYLIAVYGVWGLLAFGFYLFILKELGHSKDYLKSGLLVFALITTAASSLFGGAYGMGIWLIVPLLSAKLVKA